MSFKMTRKSLNPVWILSGPASLQTWFYTLEGEGRGACYVYVTKTE